MTTFMVYWIEAHWYKNIECMTFWEGEFFMLILSNYDVDIGVEVVSEFLEYVCERLMWFIIGTKIYNYSQIMT